MKEKKGMWGKHDQDLEARFWQMMRKVGPGKKCLK
jgi:hypothetical protein